MDFIGDFAPPPCRLIIWLSFQLICRTIEGDPSHNLLMYEVLRPTAYFPNTFVGLAPSGGQMFQYHAPQRLAAFGWLHPRFESLKHRVGDLAKDVDLELLVGSVANP